MTASFVDQSSGATASGLTVADTIPAAGQVGDLCLAVVCVGESTQSTNPLTLPEDWQHGYDSPYDSLFHEPSNSHLHGVLAWKILEAGEPNTSVSFTRTNVGSPASMSVRLYVFRHSGFGFNTSDPFDVQLSRATNLSAQSSTSLGVVTIPDGDIAVTCCVAELSSGGFWTRSSGWSAAGGVFTGSTSPGLDLIYRQEAGSGDSVTSALFAYISNNKWVHWAFTFAEAPPPSTTPTPDNDAEFEVTPYWTEAWPIVNHHSDFEADQVFKIKQGDTAPPISGTLKENKAVRDLTEASSVALRWRRKGTTATVSNAATIDDATAGAVSYTWAAGDTDDPGVYFAEWVVSWNDGTEQSYPTVGYFTFEITEGIETA